MYEVGGETSSKKTHSVGNFLSPIKIKQRLTIYLDSLHVPLEAKDSLYDTLTVSNKPETDGLVNCNTHEEADTLTYCMQSIFLS